MQVNGVPNKYEIYQDYYFEVNGEEISYTEALNLFYQMSSDERSEFEQYYKDETGYEIIDANGYSFGENASEKNNINKANIMTKYNIEAYAKKNGLVLDPVWSQYSAEEILQMVDNGVNIPQEIVDIAQAIQQQTATNYETTGENEENNTEETTEKEPFLELIPKAEEKIEKCNETNDKIDAEIEKIIPEQEKQERTLTEKLKQQRNTLDEYADNVREWTKLQDKMNSGEALTESENNRYSELSEILGSKKNNDDGFEIDKTEIADSLNQINILAVIGKELAEETIEIGDTLADYTSQSNYKTTKQSTTQQIGLLKSIIAMAQGKTLANEANKTGNDTKEYAEQTTTSINNIASSLDIEDRISKIEGEPENNQDEGTETEADSSISTGEAKDENSGEKTEENSEEKLKTFITDSYVMRLIDEGQLINADLQKQIEIALGQIKTGVKDTKMASIADKNVTKIVDKFWEEEEKRQQEIEQKQKENEEAENELKKLTGKSSEEIDKEIIKNNNRKSNNENEPDYDEETKEKIKKQKEIIVNNNEDIKDIKSDSIRGREEVQQNTSREKSAIDKALPVENNALKINSTYQEKDLPEHNERMDFINSAGTRLMSIGTGEVLLGGKQIQIGQALLASIFTWQQGIALIALGTLTIVKGTTSIGIGAKACKVSDDESLIEQAEESTDAAGSSINSALSGLNTVNEKIVEVTKEFTGENSQDTNTNESSSSEPSEQSSTESTATAAEQTTSETPVSEADEPISAEQTTAQETKNTSIETSETENITTRNAENTEETSAETTAQKTENIVAKPEVKNIKDNYRETISQKPNTKETDEEQDTKKTLNSIPSTTNTSTSSEKKDDEMTTDDAQESVDDTNTSAKDDSKESEQLKKETDKTTKELEKETKQLDKLMKKDQKELVKMTKESTDAAKKQEEILTEFEALVAENEQLIAEDENKQNTQSLTRTAAPQSSDENNGIQQGILGSSQMTATGGQQDSNEDKIANNDARINELGVSFQTYGKKIERNRTKFVRIQKTTKTRQKKFNKKTDLIEEKNKEAEKKELDKQKKLQKQLGAVGIAENVFQITLSTGLILSLNPFTAAAGQVMVNIGTYGVLSCGVTKATINIAHGNLTAGLMSLGQCAISLATSATGVGAAAGGVLGTVSSGLNIVASSAELVNNVRAVQGKEASGVFSKIATVAGVASSITSSAATLSNLAKSGASTFGKTMQIAGITGSALSSASQLMTEFGAEGNAANILGMIGGAASTIAALGMIADKKFGNASEKNKENQEKTESVKNKNEQVNENGSESKSLTDMSDKELKQVSEQTTEQSMKDEKYTTTTISGENETIQGEAVGQAADESNGIHTATISNTGNEALNQKLQPSSNSLQDAIKGMGVDKLSADAQVKMNELSGQIKQQQQQQIESQISKNNKKETWSNVINAVSGVASTAGSFFSNSGEQEQQQKKKAPAGRLTKRTKEIMKKNQKRIAALANKGYNI